MSIVRVKKDTKYFTASNEPFNDVRLSWETRGLMGYLLSKPNNWQIRMDALEKAGPAGNYKLRRMLSEARQYGYVNRIRVSVANNKFDWISEVYESPSLNPNPSKEIIKAKASGGFPTSGLSTSGKLPDIVITESVITESVIDDELLQRTALFSKLYEENVGPLTPLLADYIQDAVVDYPKIEWYAPAFLIAVENNVRKLSYVRSVLQGWKDNYFGWKPEYIKTGKGKGKAVSPQIKTVPPEEVKLLQESTDWSVH